MHCSAVSLRTSGPWKHRRKLQRTFYLRVVSRVCIEQRPFRWNERFRESLGVSSTPLPTIALAHAPTHPLLHSPIRPLPQERQDPIPRTGQCWQDDTPSHAQGKPRAGARADASPQHGRIDHREHQVQDL